MAAVTASPHDLDAEEAGDLSLELIAVRYTGQQTLWDTEQHLRQAGWPGLAPLDGGATADDVGSWQVALVADRYLSRYEGRPDLEVVYPEQREQMAQVILDIDDDPTRALENVFGPGSDSDLRERVFDALGIDTEAKAGPFEEQLRDLAGIDEEEVEEDTADKSLVATLTSESEGYSRRELGDICKALRDGPGDFNLQQNASKTERAEFIASFDRTERKAAIDAALGDRGDA